MERPTGVTVLAVLAFIFTGLCVIAALMFFMGGSMLSMMTQSSGMGAILGGATSIIGVVCLFIAALYAAVGFGLWKLMNWGRILCIVLVALGAVSAALGAVKALMPMHAGVFAWQILWVAIDAWIITYLLKPHVKQAFGA